MMTLVITSPLYRIKFLPVTTFVIDICTLTDIHRHKPAEVGIMV